MPWNYNPRYNPPGVAYNPKAPKGPKKNKRPGKGRKGTTFADFYGTSPEEEADRIISELLSELGLARDSARREAERSASSEIARSQALAQALTSLGIPSQIQGIYNNSAQATAGLAGGFSGDVQALAGQQAAEMGNMVSGTGQEGAVRSQGANMGNVLYGTEGFIPARSLEQMGAAFASEAALQPGFTLQFGQLAANKVMEDFNQRISGEFTDKEAEIRSKRAGLVADARDRRRQEAEDLYRAGLITQREFARRMGVKNWRKFPNTLPGDEKDRPKASASLSKAVGYLVDEYGAPILNAKGKVIPLPKDPSKIDRFGSASSGYWAWNPETGEIVNLLPPQPKTYAPKGYQLKTLKDGSTAIFDPNTGQTTVIAPPPKGSSKPKLTTAQRAAARSWSFQFAKDALSGGTDEAGNELPPLSLPAALNQLREMIASGEVTVPWALAKNIVVSYYRKHYVGPLAPGPKGKPPKGGSGSIRIPTSWQGTHVTDGLGWGTKTAADIMGAPNTPVYLPDDVTVVYYHPTGAQGGGSMLVRTRNGREYWLGHIYANVRPGQRIRRGTPIAYISPDHPAPHVHVDRRGVLV